MFVPRRDRNPRSNVLHKRRRLARRPLVRLQEPARLKSGGGGGEVAADEHGVAADDHEVSRVWERRGRGSECGVNGRRGDDASSGVALGGRRRPRRRHELAVRRPEDQERGEPARPRGPQHPGYHRPVRAEQQSPDEAANAAAASLLRVVVQERGALDVEPSLAAGRLRGSRVADRGVSGVVITFMCSRADRLDGRRRVVREGGL